MVRWKKLTIGTLKAAAKREASREVEEMILLHCRVQQVRRQKEIKQSVLAEKCGLSVPALSRLERGLSEPGVLSALRVAEVLDCGVRELWPSSEKVRIEQTKLLTPAAEAALDPNKQIAIGGTE